MTDPSDIIGRLREKRDVSVPGVTFAPTADEILRFEAAALIEAQAREIERKDARIGALTHRMEHIRGFVTDPDRMLHWDRWRASIAAGDRSDGPRQGFESVLFFVGDEANDALSALANPPPRAG